MLRAITHLTFALAGVIFLSNTTTLAAQQAVPYDKGPVHEAFIAPITGSVVLQAIAAEPPARITEHVPPKCDPEAIWIPGYWSWEEQINDFIWVSGAWRVPPPGHMWVSGYWKKFNAGWVWIRGFWSAVPANDISYLPKRPPDTIQENIPNAPGDNYFWMQGYWHFDGSKYKWLNGQWAEFDPEWIYVPAHYVWRPEGYVFIPAYWDWTLEDRGCAYSSVTIDPGYRGSIIYTPVVILEPPMIIDWIFWFYPDYTWFFWHHWHFHPGFWAGWCCVPPWWQWQGCWCFSWQNTWWLWWWWGNPGFMNPPWIFAAMAANMPPPPQQLVIQLGNIMPPPIVFPWGVVTPEDLIDAISQNQGNNDPIMPGDRTNIEEIEEQLKPEKPSDTEPLRPTGDPSDLHKPHTPPNIPVPDVPQGGSVVEPTKPDYGHGHEEEEEPEEPEGTYVEPPPINPPKPPSRVHVITPVPTYPARPHYVPPRQHYPQTHYPRPHYNPPPQRPHTNWPQTDRPHTRPNYPHGETNHTYPGNQSNVIHKPMRWQQTPTIRWQQTSPQIRRYQHGQIQRTNPGQTQQQHGNKTYY